MSVELRYGRLVRTGLSVTDCFVCQAGGSTAMLGFGRRFGPQQPRPAQRRARAAVANTSSLLVGSPNIGDGFCPSFFFSGASHSRFIPVFPYLSPSLHPSLYVCIHPSNLFHSNQPTSLNRLTSLAGLTSIYYQSHPDGCLSKIPVELLVNLFNNSLTPSKQQKDVKTEYFQSVRLMYQERL